MFCFCLSSDEREAVMVHLKQVSFKGYKLYMCFMHALLKGCGHSTKCLLFNCVLPTVETVEEQIVRQLTEKRINDLNESLAETKEEYLYVHSLEHSSFPGHASFLGHASFPGHPLFPGHAFILRPCLIPSLIPVFASSPVLAFCNSPRTNEWL